MKKSEYFESISVLDCFLVDFVLCVDVYAFVTWLLINFVLCVDVYYFGLSMREHLRQSISVIDSLSENVYQRASEPP